METYKKISEEEIEITKTDVLRAMKEDLEAEKASYQAAIDKIDAKLAVFK